MPRHSGDTARPTERPEGAREGGTSTSPDGGGRAREGSSRRRPGAASARPRGGAGHAGASGSASSSARGHRQAGPVKYMDASGLKRPLDLPRAMWPILAVILVVAAFFGVRMAHSLDYNVAHHSDRVKEQVQAEIDRGVAQDVPVLSGYAGMDDDAILQSMTDAGFTYVDMNEINGTGEATIDVIKLPSDMTVDDAAAAYTDGVSSLDNITAAKFLSGSWRFMAVRDSGYSYSVKYADFSSGGPEAAVQAAVQAQGFADSSMGDAGVDDNGNTFQEGSIDIDGSTYAWSISACSLSDVYSVRGMPDDAQYVGVRFETT